MIGVFDSGLGGLTIAKAIRDKLPNYNYLYLGDTLHVPYGNRSDESVFKLTKSACDYLFENGCTLIILACNTASSRALRRLQQEYLPEKRNQLNKDVNILGVIRPMAEYIAQLEVKKVGVIGTRGTINSKAYVLELKGQKKELDVYQQSTPLLVPLIEEDRIDSVEMKSILNDYLQPLRNIKVDTLILGCTHYSLILELVQEMMGDCQIPDPAEVIANSLADYSVHHPEYFEKLDKPGFIEYQVTDYTDNFQSVAEKFLSEKINIKKVKLD